VYMKEAHELILDSLEFDEIALYNLSHTCIEAGTALPSVKEAIRDSMTGSICHSDSSFYARIYYIDVDRKCAIPIRRNALLKGLDIAQWAVDMLPRNYGTFAIMMRPKDAPQDASKRKVWVFMAR